MISLIAATARNGTIGDQGKLPWHVSGDLKHFKQVTNGFPMIMGSTTYESLPGILPNRHHIVVSSRNLYVPDEAKVTVVRSIEDAIGLGKMLSSEVFVIGGESIYRQTIGLADRLIISNLDIDYEGDRFFPDFSEDDWKCKLTEIKFSEPESINFSVQYYYRRT